MALERHGRATVNHRFRRRAGTDKGKAGSTLFGDVMHRLILLRHAKAESGAGVADDFARGLTERGRRDAAAMGRVLASEGFAPDLVLASSARRAQQTWDEAAPAFPGAKLEATRALYLASPAELRALIAARRADASIGALMIIGHNPGLYELAASFPGLGRPLVGFPTASAAVIGFDDQGQGRLERHLAPRDFGDVM